MCGSDCSAEVYFSAELLELSLSNLLELSLKGIIWQLKHVRAEEMQVDLEVSKDTRDHLENMRLSPAREGASHTIASGGYRLEAYWRRKMVWQNPQGSSSSRSVYKETSLETSHVIGDQVKRAKPPTDTLLDWKCASIAISPSLIFDVSPFVLIPDVTTWAGLSWNGPALCKVRKHPAKTWREEKWK